MIINEESGIFFSIFDVGRIQVTGDSDYYAGYYLVPVAVLVLA